MAHAGIYCAGVTFARRKSVQVHLKRYRLHDNNVKEVRVPSARNIADAIRRTNREMTNESHEIGRCKQHWTQLPYPAGPWVKPDTMFAIKVDLWDGPLKFQLSDRVAFGARLFYNMVMAEEGDFKSVRRVRAEQGRSNNGPRHWQYLVRGRWQFDLRGIPYKDRTYLSPWGNLVGWERVLRLSMLYTFAKNPGCFPSKTRLDVYQYWSDTVNHLGKKRTDSSVPLASNFGSETPDRQGYVQLDEKRAWCGYFLRVFLSSLALNPIEFQQAFLPALIQLLRHLVSNDPNHLHATVAAMVARELSEAKERALDSNYFNWIIKTTPNSAFNALFNHSCLTMDVSPQVVERWISSHKLGWRVENARTAHDLAQTAAAMLTDPITYSRMFISDGHEMNRHPAQILFGDVKTFMNTTRPRRTSRPEGFPPNMDWNVLQPIRLLRLWHWPWMVAWLSNPDPKSPFQSAMSEAGLNVSPKAVRDAPPQARSRQIFKGS
jgi:hypothetical protein